MGGEDGVRGWGDLTTRVGMVEVADVLTWKKYGSSEKKCVQSHQTPHPKNCHSVIVFAILQDVESNNRKQQLKEHD